MNQHAYYKLTKLSETTAEMDLGHDIREQEASRKFDLVGSQRLADGHVQLRVVFQRPLIVMREVKSSSIDKNH